MRHTSRFALRLASSAAALALAGPAFAQEGPAAPPEDDSNVVVITGVGPARSSDEMIASTTVLNEDALVERLSGGLGDTLAGLPGISTTAFGPGASRPIIRGLGAERVQVLTNGIGVVDASAASPDHAVTGDPLGAERIEILRGPASLAYGGGATGGVVNVIDGLIVERKPDETFSGSLYGGLTSADEGKQAAARVTGVLGDLVGVVSGSWLDANNVDIPGFALSQGAREQAITDGVDPATFANGTLPNSAVETQSISAGLSWVGDTMFLGGAVRKLDNRYGTVAEPDVFIDLEQTRYDVRGGIRFDDGWLKSVVASGSKVDYAHTEFEGPGEPGTRFTNDGWEARLEAQHAALAGFEGSFGLQSSSRDFAAVGDESVIGPTQTEQTGVFVYETFDQGDWGLEGGLRYDTVDVDNIVGGVRAFEPWNASFGGHLHVGEHIFLGASVAGTERAPTDLELFANGPHLATGQFLVGDANLETEKGVNYELTARWEDGAFNVSGSLYRFDFDRFVYLQDTGLAEPGPEEDLPIFDYVQAGATFTGFELQADTQLGNAWGVDWKADAAADFVRAKLKAGGNLPLIPPLTVNAGIEGEINGVTGRLQVQYAAKQDDFASFETQTDSYTTVDARLGFDIAEGVHLILEGKNLTDEEVRLHTSPLKEIAPMTGRNFRVAVRADF
jgi:iron complex outermembrane receptor protein